VVVESVSQNTASNHSAADTTEDIRFGHNSFGSDCFGSNRFGSNIFGNNRFGNSGADVALVPGEKGIFTEKTGILTPPEKRS
jgi:hypothetical protein